MAASNANDVLEVSVIGDFNQASELANVYQFQCLAGLTSAEDLLDDIEEIVVLLYTIAKALHTSLVAWRKFRVRNLTQGTIVGEQSLATPIQGTATGDMMPPGVAALTYFGTGVPHVQMRKYWGAIAETHSDGDGTLNTACRTIVLSLVTNLLAGFVRSGDSYTYGFQSPKTGTFLPATSGAYSEQFAYQRRRKPGLGS